MDMYNKKTNLLIGFHGCDKSVRDAVINGGQLKPSLNDYDWLGNGTYFWENDYIRALEWAEQAAKRTSSSVKEPAVLGAVIDLGNCLDFTNRDSVPILKAGYEWLKESHKREGRPMPRNKNVKGNNDFLLRELDCAVIQSIHKISREKDSPFEPYDSVRGLFLEGNSVYEGACIKEKTHIQLCIINPNCVKGYFVPRRADKRFPIP